MNLLMGKKTLQLRERAEPLDIVETAKCRGQRPDVATSTVGEEQVYKVCLIKPSGGLASANRDQNIVLISREADYGNRNEQLLAPTDRMPAP
jgi:hypothetical protein